MNTTLETETQLAGSLRGRVVPRRVHLLYRVWRDVSSLADQCERAGHDQLHRELYEVSERALLEFERHNK